MIDAKYSHSEKARQGQKIDYRSVKSEGSNEIGQKVYDAWLQTRQNLLEEREVPYCPASRLK